MSCVLLAMSFLSTVMNELASYNQTTLQHRATFHNLDFFITGAGATMSRMAMFEADMPVTVPVYGVNRQCASGLQAIASIADSVHRSCSYPYPYSFSSPSSSP